MDLVIRFSVKFEKIMKLFTQYFQYFSILSMCMLFGVLMVEVIGRTFFSFSLHGIIELVEILMALTCFFSFAYTQVFSKNINVEMFTRTFSEQSQNLVKLFSEIISFAFLTLLAWYLGITVLEKFAYNELSTVYNLPIWLSVGLCTLAFAFLVLAFVLSALKSLILVLKDKQYLGIILVCLSVMLIIALPFVLKYFGFANKKMLLGALGMLYLFSLIFMSIPIAIAMLVVGIQGMIIIMPRVEIALNMACNAPYPALAFYTISVIPMFILLGELALISCVSRDLFRAASTWLGRLPGGLAISSVVGCAGFAAICGESIPTAMTMTSVALPEMRKNGYDPAFGTACLALGGTLGILIPPSIGFIIYSIITEASVAKLFMAGVIPGLLLVTIVSVMIVVRAIINPKLAPRGPKTTMSEKFNSLWGTIPMIFVFILIIGSILAGICTPTEGGAVGTMGIAIYAFIRKSLTCKTLWQAMNETVILTSKVTFIMVGVAILGYFLAATRIPFALADLIVSMNASPMTVLTAVIVLFLVLGCIMNVLPMIMLILPAIYPSMLSLGFDPIWFGVITVLLMELGQITPPMGLLVFAISGAVPDVPVEAIFKQISPFFIAILLTIILIVIFPSIATWLPSVLL